LNPFSSVHCAPANQLRVCPAQQPLWGNTAAGDCTFINFEGGNNMFPDFIEWSEYLLDPVFLITTGLVVLTFAPLLWSVWVTWQENEE
jgi:hypothetical protein